VPKKSERPLLLVDDSAFFRNMLSPVLKAAGYTVTAVPSAREALELLRKGGRVDALVTDHRHAGHGRLRARGKRSAASRV